MKRFFKTSVLSLSLAALVFTATSCGAIKPVPYPGFTIKAMEGRGYKIVVRNMQRGDIPYKSRMRQDPFTNDAIFFDVAVGNISQQQLIASGRGFKLITNDGAVVDAATTFEGGFDDPLENKSGVLYPGTRKTGTIAFALKRTSFPKKLIFDTPYGTLECNLP